MIRKGLPWLDDVIGGADLGDFLTRDETLSALLAASDGEIARGQARLKTPEEQLSHFRFLNSALQARFPIFKAEVEKPVGQPPTVRGRCASGSLPLTPAENDCSSRNR